MNKLTNLSRSINSWVYDKVIVLLCTFMTLLPIHPGVAPFVTRDSGVFLYVGWRIINGEIPYVDVWDHKPPIVFYINALGLWLSNNSRWGVWIIEFVSLFIAVCFGYKLFKSIFGKYPAILTTFLWTFSLFFLIENGNFTTEYTLPLQFATLFIYFSVQEKNSNKPTYFLIGILGGIAFFTKQTTIGIWLAIIILLIIKVLKRNSTVENIKKILLILFGGLSVLFFVSGYFYLNNALYEFWDIAFVYNYFYSTQNGHTLFSRFLSLVNVRDISIIGFFQIATIGLVSFVFLSEDKKLKMDNGAVSLLFVGLINFPIELILINIPGSTYRHYFITMLPVLAIFSGFLFNLICENISIRCKKNSTLELLFTSLIILIIALSGIKERMLYNGYFQTRFNEPAVEYVLRHTNSEDFVLLWGAETMVNFHSERQSPTRYVYQYPLYKLSYTSEEKIIEFLDDIIGAKPKLIFDTMREEFPIFVLPIQSDEVDQRLVKIRSIYKKVDEVNSWHVYELILN